ncbi:MAG TPA: hypothetical protein PLS90_05570 [Candidatus Sumerlaeota bacterium]|nr:hypothetical protein [Candidatus Sumerlaeota bacterium]HOR26874.1 hypothetical protein [Candidatus Sumerlaeota bacterium]HPK01906.1 hypothetical protein [Candidatus Sumerlaeota bacterium]
MIQINLLENSSTRHRARTAAAGGGAAGGAGTGAGAGGLGAIVWLALILVLGANGGLGWIAWSKVKVAGDEFRAAERKQKQIEEQIEKQLTEAEQVRKFREVINNQLDVLRSLDPPDRILWSQKVNMLANLIPANVFLTELDIQEDVTMVETEASKAAREAWKKSKAEDKGKEPQPVMRPVIKYIVRLTGVALGNDAHQQFENVTRFHHAMINHVEEDAQGGTVRFMDGFQSNIEFEKVEATVYQGTPCNAFTFKLTTHPMGQQENAPAAEKRQVASAR